MFNSKKLRTDRKVSNFFFMLEINFIFLKLVKKLLNFSLIDIDLNPLIIVSLFRKQGIFQKAFLKNIFKVRSKKMSCINKFFRFMQI